jgi:hypothetical protein
MTKAPKTLSDAKIKAKDPKLCAAFNCPDSGKPTPIPDSEQVCKWTVSLCSFHGRILQGGNKLSLARERGIKGQIAHADNR